MAFSMKLAFASASFVLSRAETSDFQKLRGSPQKAQNASRKLSLIKLDRPFVLTKDFDLSADPKEAWDLDVMPDENMTHSCSNYVDDGSTVFTRDGNLVLKVSSASEDGKSLNSGRVMSKDGFKYGIFVFKAKVPKCNYIWPALWLLPESSKGDGEYGTWPCSGEIDVLETVNDDSWGAFNLVAGYGAEAEADDHCAVSEKPSCSCDAPGYCTSSTLKFARDSFYHVQDVDCSVEHPSWDEHTFVLYWQPEKLATWVDPELKYDGQGRLVDIKANEETRTLNVWGEEREIPKWISYERKATPTWAAVETFMEQCFNDKAAIDAPFDKDFKIVLNIAVGGYGGAPCTWDTESCTSTCGGAVGSELVISDLKVYERM